MCCGAFVVGDVERNEKTSRKKRWWTHPTLSHRISIGNFHTSFNNHRICGNKMPTRCNRGFYCRSYCLLNMFRAPLCPSSGAQEYYTVVAACGISCCGFSSCCSGVELRVMCPVCRMLQHTRPAT